MYNISNEAKQKLLESATIKRAYISIVPLSIEDPIIINETNRLQQLKIEDIIYGKTLVGGTVAKKCTVKFLNIDEEYNLENREIDVFIGIEISEDNVEYIPYGRYIINYQPKNKTVESTSTAEGLDYMVKFNVDYVDDLTYPCTLKDVLNSICIQSGVSLGTDSIPNEDFVVENNQFTGGESCRNVLNAISQLAGGNAHIGRDNKLYIKSLDEISEETDVIDNNEYYELEKNDVFGPINTVILRNSQVEGENVSEKNQTSIDNNGATELSIADNPFAYTQEKREELITEIYNTVNGFSYTPFSFKYIARPYLDSFDKVTVKDMQGNNFSSYIFNHDIEYNGGLSGKIETETTTKTETKYKFTPTIAQSLKKTEIMVDKANGEITSLSKEQSSQSSKLSEITQNVNSVNINLEQAGGLNLIKDSTLRLNYSNNIKTGTVTVDQNKEISDNTISKSAIKINTGSVQFDTVNTNEDINYTFSCKIYKLELANVKVTIISKITHEYNIECVPEEFVEFEFEINDNINKIDIKIECDSNYCLISDCMLNKGSKLSYQPYQGEIIGENYTFADGLEITNTSTNSKLIAKSDGIKIINSETNEERVNFNGDNTQLDRVTVVERINIGNLRFSVMTNGHTMVTFDEEE